MLLGNSWRGICKKIVMSCIIMMVLLNTIPDFFNTGLSMVDAASAPSGILGNGTGGIYIDINSAPYTTYQKKPRWGINAYTEVGCAWFASARVYQLTGKDNPIYSGSTWYNTAYSTYGFTRGNVPQAKALACWEGHVAVVEAVNGDTLIVSDGGHTGNIEYGGSDAAHGFCVIRAVDRTEIESNISGKWLGYVYLGKVATEDYRSSFPLKNGATYKIVSALSGKTMEVPSGTTENSKQIGVWSYSGEPWMQWKAVQQADGYSFINAYTGKCLDIKDASTSGGAKLTQFDYSGNAAQRFKLVDKGNGKYGMIAVCSNLAVDLCGSSKENGALLDQHAFHGGDNQLWIFEPVDTKAPTIDDVQISNLNANGYTVSCKVVDAGGVATVYFPTWTEANGQDDLPADWPTSTRVVGDIYYYDVNTADHNNEGGVYNTHIYAYDIAGNHASTGVCVTVNKEIPLTGFNINASSLNMYIGTREALRITQYTPSDTTDNRTPIWTSSNSAIASVDSTGNVVAHAAGTAVISCTVMGITRTCSVTVAEIAAGEWTDWTESLSGDITGDTHNYEVQQITQYRYQTKQTTESLQSTLAGWTKYGEYWGGWQTSTTEVAATDSREVNRQDTFVKTQYNYSHWHKGNYTSPREPSGYTGYTYEETGWLDYALTYYGDSSVGGKMYKGSAELGPCKWKTNWSNEQTRDIYNTTWNYRDKVYQYYLWSNWSEWSENPVSANDNTNVETRILYRYRKLSYPLKVEKVLTGGDNHIVNQIMNLEVQASGGQPSYWYKFTVVNQTNGQEDILQEYTTSNKVSWTPSKAGKYTVNVDIKDSADTVVTSSETVTVLPEPILILSQPQDANLEWGQNGAFNVQVDGDAFYYQWYVCRNGSDIFEKVTAEESGYNSNTLQVIGNIENKNAKYKCVISGNDNQVVETNTVTLHVNIPEISIEESPIDISVEEGSNAYFSLKASGADLKYQWQYLPNDSSEWLNYNEKLSDSDDAVIQIVTSMEWNGTKFRCVIIDCQDKQITTEPVTLTVTEKVTVYTIEYILNGGINHEDNVVSYRAGETITLLDPTYEGKVFGGWYTVDGKQVTSVSGESIVVEAKWFDVVDDERKNGELWIEEIPNQLYTGKTVKPEIRVYNGQILLTEKVDYTVSYKNNIKANDATDIKTAPQVIVTGIGNYTSKETATFVIEQKDLNDYDVTVEDICVAANGKLQKLVPTINWNGKKLRAKTDFIVEYPDKQAGAYQNMGKYTVRVTGTGNFTGTRDVELEITGTNLISKAVVAKIADQAYTGTEIEPMLNVRYGSVYLTKDVDYSVEFENNVMTGTATAIIIGKGNYAGEKRVTFKIIGKSISKAKVEKLPKSVIYNGTNVNEVDYELRFTENNETILLIENEDYVVSYQNAGKAGTATIIFTGINGYTGTLKKTYKILPYDLGEDNEQLIEVQLEESMAYMKGGTTANIVVTCDGKKLQMGKDYSLTYKNNKIVSDGNTGRKTPTVVVKGKGNYKGSKEFTFTITKQKMSLLAISVPDISYQNKAGKYISKPVIKDINGKTLTAGVDYEKQFTYSYAEDTVLTDGTLHKAGTIISSRDVLPAGTKVTITVHGKGNYIGELSGTYRIVKADIGKASGKVSAQVYTGKPITPGQDCITLKSGKIMLTSDDYEIVSYSNNIKKGTATVVVKGIGNYGGTKTLKFTIKSKLFSWWWR